MRPQIIMPLDPSIPFKELADEMAGLPPDDLFHLLETFATSLQATGTSKPDYLQYKDLGRNLKRLLMVTQAAIAQRNRESLDPKTVSA